MEISVILSVTAPEHRSHCWAALAPEKGGDRRAPRLTITNSSMTHIVSSHLKRFPRTKHVFKALSYRLKRFRGTKFRFYYPTGKSDREK